MFLHNCYCGKWGAFGFDVRVRDGREGVWFCTEHRLEGEMLKDLGLLYGKKVRK